MNTATAGSSLARSTDQALARLAELVRDAGSVVAHEGLDALGD